MTVADFYLVLSRYTIIILLFFSLLPLITYLIARLLQRAARHRGCALFLAVMVHLAVIPGVGNLLILGYLLFFTSTNLFTQLDILLFLPPVISMVVTLLIIRKIMPFSQIPGFGRLSGLILITGLCFFLILLIYKLRLFVGFFLSFQGLLILFIVLFVIFKIALARIRKN